MNDLITILLYHAIIQCDFKENLVFAPSSNIQSRFLYITPFYSHSPVFKSQFVYNPFPTNFLQPPFSDQFSPATLPTNPSQPIFSRSVLTRPQQSPDAAGSSLVRRPHNGKKPAAGLWRSLSAGRTGRFGMPPSDPTGSSVRISVQKS